MNALRIILTSLATLALGCAGGAADADQKAKASGAGNGSASASGSASDSGSEEQAVAPTVVIGSYLIVCDFSDATADTVTVDCSLQDGAGKKVSRAMFASYDWNALDASSQVIVQGVAITTEFLDVRFVLPNGAVSGAQIGVALGDGTKPSENKVAKPLAQALPVERFPPKLATCLDAGKTAATSCFQEAEVAIGPKPSEPGSGSELATPVDGWARVITRAESLSCADVASTGYFQAQAACTAKCGASPGVSGFFASCEGDGDLVCLCAPGLELRDRRQGSGNCETTGAPGSARGKRGCYALCKSIPVACTADGEAATFQCACPTTEATKLKILEMPLASFDLGNSAPSVTDLTINEDGILAEADRRCDKLCRDDPTQGSLGGTFSNANPSSALCFCAAKP